jgi:FkbH-like protein
MANWEKWNEAVQAKGFEEFIRIWFVPPADYLINSLQADDVMWRDLYVGQTLELMRRPGEDVQAAIAQRQLIAEKQREAILRLLSPLVDQECLVFFDQHLGALHEFLGGEVGDNRTARVLFVGDCLFEFIVDFLTLSLLEQGIWLRPEFSTSRNPMELKRSICNFAKDKFDLICYSPYSTAFNLTLSELFSSSNPMRSSREIRRLSLEAHQQTLFVIRLLADQFECNVSVQNTLNIRPNDGSLLSHIKSWVTRRPRSIAAREVNALLDRTISDLNRELPHPLIKVDEVGLKKKNSEHKLSEIIYDSGHYHPTVIAQKLSALYRNLILANKLLSTRKVVVIDLDDTIWKGTIGEGAIEHYYVRQEILRMLRLKGALLAIASRNDPRNVHWTGGVLQAGDFVAEQINWDPKPINIRRIAAELNIKLKDFVFIDDRADQRELVKSSFPEVHVLDANLESTWEMLRYWADSMPEQAETDRTQLYHERKKRESFLKRDAEELDLQKLFGSLGIEIDFHTASRKELPRVVELINRTNQFNTCGSRTSLQEVKDWSESSAYSIQLAEAWDKFGAMGIVSAMILEITESALVIRAWVLSCRVFGYGIETAMLNHVRKRGQLLKLDSIHGLIVETAHNQPCREVYSTNGFVRQSTIWVTEAVNLSAHPPWLGIRSHEVMDDLSLT